MSQSNSTQASVDPAEILYTRGLMAAVEMMEGMAGGADIDAHALSNRYRDGKPQDNSVYDAVTRLLERGHADELRGFCAVLTEIISDVNQHGDMERMYRGYATRRRRAMVRRSIPLRARAAALPA